MPDRVDAQGMSACTCHMSGGAKVLLGMPVMCMVCIHMHTPSTFQAPGNLAFLGNVIVERYLDFARTLVSCSVLVRLV